MATATTRAQELITCDLNCDKPVQQFCNSCQVGLCADCINKHVNNLKSMKHDIVPFTNRTVHLVYPQCTTHAYQRCEGHCQQCDIPVCMECVMSSSHKHHDIVNIAGMITTKKERINRETEEIKAKIIPKNKKQDSDIEKKISECTAHYSDLMKKSKDKRKQWHVEVDDIFDNLDTRTQSLRDFQIAALKSYQSQLRSQNSSMIQTVQENKEILKSNNVSDVNNYKSRLTEFRNIPQVPDSTPPSLKTNTIQGRELSLELREYKAKLTQSTLSSLTDEVSNLSFTELLKEAKMIANIPANVKELHRVACVGSDKAWINGRDKMIQCVGIYESVQDTSTVNSTCRYFPNDITVNRQGELIYSDGHNRTVNIVRHGKTETLITTPQGWHPVGLCCTRSGDILVSMRTDDNSHYKMVRYQGQRVTQEIDKDGRGNPIYQGGKYPVYVTENNNGDIVASDPNADRVVVVDRAGKVRFRYDKRPGEQQPFFPTQIVTDSMGHIIVGDQFNHCLHILDQNGGFLRCVDNCGLYEPIGLSVDSEGRLWVGLHDSSEVKVIQYMK